MEAPALLLTEVNANNREVLYRCRWSEETASDIVPKLVALLTHDTPTVVAESLRALHCIGPRAVTAAAPIERLLEHPDPNVSHLAVSTLGRVCLEDPGVATQPLIEAANRPALLEVVLLALIDFGPAGAMASPLFVRAFDSRSAKTRRLAVRALRASQASDPASIQVLERARVDSNAEVRKAATRP
jgi:HEAT repeat protein